MSTQLAERTEPYSVEQLAADVTAVVAREREQKKLVAQVEPLLARFLAGNNLDERWCQPVPGRLANGHQDFSLYRLHRGPGDCFNIMVAIWPPGGGSGVHDHAGNWVVEGVYRNRLQTLRYVRTDDGSRPGHAQLRETAVRDVFPGDVAHVINPDEAIHDFVNPTDTPTVSVHIYGGDISRETLNYFDVATQSVESIAHDLKYDNE